MKNILIIEDNEAIVNILVEYLSKSGYFLKYVTNGLHGIKEVQKNHFDLILLDITLPFKSGDEILKEIRTFSNIPIIIISAKDLVRTKVDLLKLGADDYITKPFDLDEVIARIESTLRRVSNLSIKTTSHKDLILNTQSKTFYINNRILNLTPKEYMILELLITNKDKVFTKANLYETVWKQNFLNDDNLIKSHISNIRNKLKKLNPNEEYIETVWGLGYRLYKN